LGIELKKVSPTWGYSGVLAEGCEHGEVIGLILIFSRICGTRFRVDFLPRDYYDCSEF
jgi:hypothetical protein